MFHKSDLKNYFHFKRLIYSYTNIFIICFMEFCNVPSNVCIQRIPDLKIRNLEDFNKLKNKL